MAVVVGYIPTREGRAALDVGVHEALRRSTVLVVVSSRGNELATAGDELAHDLAGYLGLLTEAGLPHQVRHLTRLDDPAEDLLKIADEVKADLIVIGLRRRSPVGKLLLGSNAQRILLDAMCPVLAVKAGPASSPADGKGQERGARLERSIHVTGTPDAP